MLYFYESEETISLSTSKVNKARIQSPSEPAKNSKRKVLKESVKSVYSLNDKGPSHCKEYSKVYCWALAVAILVGFFSLVCLLPRSFMPCSKSGEVESPIGTGSGTCFVLMGDSVLDNFYWLQDPKMDLKHQIEQIMGVKCTNLAVDECETRGIRSGWVARSHYQQARKEHFGGAYPYHLTEGNTSYPLKELDKLLSSKEKPRYVVLSVAGNDVRVRLGLASNSLSIVDKFRIGTGMGNAGALKRAIQPIIDDMRSSGWVSEYRKAIQALVERGVCVIPVICYLPGPGFPMPQAGVRMLLDELSKDMLPVMEEYKLPVIDLSRTFDPTDKADYGIYPSSVSLVAASASVGETTPIEPSNRSSMYIASLVKHIVENHDWEGDSTLYFGKGDSIQSERNPLKLNLANESK